MRTRLQHLARYCDIKLISPVPLIDYAALIHPEQVRGRRSSGWEHDESLDVVRPRWFYLPHLVSTHGAAMALRLRGMVRRLREEFPFDLIDAHFGLPEGIAASRLAGATGCPYLVTLRGNETLYARQPACRRALSRAMGRAARVIAVSRRLADFAVSLGVSEERVRVIGNGVDSGLFRPQDRERCRSNHGVPAGARVILSAGYLIERKGHHRIARALADLPAAAQLWIAGEAGREGQFESRLREVIRASGVEDRVRFLGAVPPPVLAELMAAADVFCLASSREGWPNVVHEALSCGTPVVATDIGAVPDMIPGDEYGIVIPPGDQPALTAGLRRALERTWDREAIAAWGSARSWPIVAEEVFEEIRSVITAQREAGRGPSC